MSTVTLAEAAKLTQDMLIAGVIESIVTVDRFYDVLPFVGIEGNSIAYNRENALGDVQMAGIGDTITAKSPATFTKVTSSLTKIIGDAEVDNMLQATQSDYTDQTGAQVMSKAKSVGRQYRSQLINGDGIGDNMTGLLSLVAAGQIIDATDADGDDLSFGVLDNLIDSVTDKDGQVDYFQMHSRTIRSYFALLRALGGAGIGEVVTLPSGVQVPGYRGVPIFRNDNIPINQTTGATTTTTTIMAGTIDDGSHQVGISGLTARNAFGLQVKNIGEKEDKDEEITRVKFYCGLALYSELGLAAATGIKN